MDETTLHIAAVRAGEIPFGIDPAGADDAHLAFIGLVRSPWVRREDCPKNVRQARERAEAAVIEIAAPYRAALAGLEPGADIHLLTWLHGARRDLAVQAPRHAAEPRGTFSLRSPVRPNPIGLHLVRIVFLDIGSGRVGIDAVDVLDATPVLDIKPYLKTVDRPPPGGLAGR